MTETKQLPMFDAVEIPLTKGQMALIDPIDADLVASAWHCTFYGYARSNDHKLMHRVIAERIMDRALITGETVDHINLSKVDNRRSNLRVCTRAENNRNLGKRRTNVSGYKGICWSNSNKGWVARIQLKKKGIHLGTFSTPEAAARAYDVAAIEHFGEFAQTNVMLGLLPPLEDTIRLSDGTEGIIFARGLAEVK